MLESFEYDQAHCYGVHAKCAIQMWRGEVSPHHVPVMERRWLRLIKEKGSFGILVVVLPSAPPPIAARREEIKRLYGDLAPHIKAVATVLEDQGLKGTAGSMVMTTIMLMSKIPYPYKNGAKLGPVASWLCHQLDGADPGALTGAVEQMRRRFADISMNEFGEPLVARLRTAAR
jgi:hypothetical protein